MNVEPLRGALRAEVEAEASSSRAAVDAECARRLADAHARAGELIREGRLVGERAVARESLRRRAAAARHGRELRLAAQRAVLDELRARAREGSLELVGDARYPALLAGLERAAKDQLGSDAELEVDPAGEGGVRAHAGSRSVDYTLPALVEREIAELGDELLELWR